MGGKAIWLRDAQSGEEKKLIDPTQEDKHFTAYIQKVLSERFFVYGTARMESCGSLSGRIFDVQRNKTIPIAFPDNQYAYFAFEQDGILYYRWNAEYETPIYVYALRLDDFGAAETIPAGENLLKNVPEANDVVEIQNLLYVPDTLYLALVESDTMGGIVAIRVFDLLKRSFIVRVPVESRHVFRAAMLGDKLYVYDIDWETDDPSSCKVGRYALEITLP